MRGLMVSVQFSLRAGWSVWMLSRNFSARSKMPIWWASGTGECHCLKLMPASKASDQSAGAVITPASMNRSPSRWSSSATSPCVWRRMYSSGG